MELETDKLTCIDNKPKQLTTSVVDLGHVEISLEEITLQNCRTGKEFINHNFMRYWTLIFTAR